jgi:hypothetical protein
MQSILNVVWENLLPALQPKALPENKTDQDLLKQTLSNLSVRETAKK